MKKNNKVVKRLRKVISCLLILSLVAMTKIICFDDYKSSNKESGSSDVIEKTVEYKNKKKVEVYSSKIKVTKTKKTKLTNKEIGVLACLVYAEAGNEPHNGKVGVANVVINRMKSKSYPNTLQGVISQKSQFGPYRSGVLKREVKKFASGKYFNGGGREKSLKAVKEALDGKNVVGTRKSFNSARVEMRRGHKNALRIKNHLFW